MAALDLVAKFEVIQRPVELLQIVEGYLTQQVLLLGGLVDEVG